MFLFKQCWFTVMHEKDCKVCWRNKYDNRLMLKKVLIFSIIFGISKHWKNFGNISTVATKLYLYPRISIWTPRAFREWDRFVLVSATSSASPIELWLFNPGDLCGRLLFMQFYHGLQSVMTSMWDFIMEHNLWWWLLIHDEDKKQYNIVIDPWWHDNEYPTDIILLMQLIKMIWWYIVHHNAVLLCEKMHHTIWWVWYHFMVVYLCTTHYNSVSMFINRHIHFVHQTSRIRNVMQLNNVHTTMFLLYYSWSTKLENCSSHVMVPIKNSSHFIRSYQ